MKKLHQLTGVRVDEKLMAKFLPYASYLNIDEVEDIEKTWKFVAEKVGMGVSELRKQILPLAALYSVAEHSRALLVALSDGALPGNVGGGYNLRTVLRRALSFIDRYGWNLDLAEICKWHAEYLEPLFPELSDNLDNVSKILGVEKRKYIASKEKAKQITVVIVKKDIDERKLLELYDSQGIQPEMIRVEAAKLGKKVVIPENFYSKVSELHEQRKQVHAIVRGERLELEGLPETEALYFEDYRKIKFGAKVLKIIDNKVILDRSYFYPTSGGQLHDLGVINGKKVVDVFKQGNIIVHVMESKPLLRIGGEIIAEINFEKRKQLTQHHTATHIVNAAAKKVLGNHVFQAGAKKTLDKAHLDITHYESISNEELRKIEDEANTIVDRALPVNSSFLNRDMAEKKYGLSIYQGGAVPGNKIRIIDISGVDVEACGGTHLHDTSEVGKIKILKSTKIQDGVCRIIFTAGNAAEMQGKGETEILDELSKLLGMEIEEIPARAEELFAKWKKAKKAVKKKKEIDVKELELVVKEKRKGDVLGETAKILKTQPEHVLKTVERFMKELDGFIKKLNSE